jgi:hypothetical protein
MKRFIYGAVAAATFTVCGASPFISPWRQPKVLNPTYEMDFDPEALAQAPANCFPSGSTNAFILPMDEASGSLAVSTGCTAGGTALTATGSPVYAQTAPTGLGTSISMPSGAYFQTAGDVASANIGSGAADTFYVRTWFKSCVKTNGEIIASKRDSGSVAGWDLQLTAGGTLFWDVGDSGGTSCHAIHDAAFALNDCSWHLIYGTFNNSAKSATIQIDGDGTGVTATCAGITLANITNAKKVTIGNYADTTLATHDAFQVADFCFSGNTGNCLPIGDTDTNTGLNRYLQGPRAPPNASYAKTDTTASTMVDKQSATVRSAWKGQPPITAGLDANGQLLALKRTGYYANQSTTFKGIQNDGLLGWTATNVTKTTSAATDPGGTLIANNLNDSSGAAVGDETRVVTVAADLTTWTMSAWVRCATPHTARIAEQISTGGSCVPTTNTNTFTCGTAWQRYTESLSNNNCTSLTLHLDPTDSTAGSTGDIDVWRVEAWNSGIDVLKEPSVGAADITIAADALSYPNVSVTDTGTFCTWFWPGGCPNANVGTPPEGFIAYWDNTHDWDFQVAGGCSTVTLDLAAIGVANPLDTRSTTTMSVQGWHHACAAWDQPSSSAKLYIDGAEVTYGVHDQAWTAAGTYGTTMLIGDDTAAACITCKAHGIISHFRYYQNRQLSDSDIRRVYLSESGLFAEQDNRDQWTRLAAILRMVLP